VDVSISNSGAVSVNGKMPPSYPFTYTFSRKTNVTIEAIPASGYAFKCWSGCASGSSNPATFVLSRARSVTAYFSAQEQVSSIEGLVWNDLNADGLRDAGEYANDAYRENLRSSDSDIIVVTTTRNGDYSLGDTDPPELIPRSLRISGRFGPEFPGTAGMMTTGTWVAMPMGVQVFLRLLPSIAW